MAAALSVSSLFNYGATELLDLSFVLPLISHRFVTQH